MDKQVTNKAGKSYQDQALVSSYKYRKLMKKYPYQMY